MPDPAYIALALAILEFAIIIGMWAGLINAGSQTMEKRVTGLTHQLEAHIDISHKTFARKDVVITWQQSVDRRLDEQSESINRLHDKLDRILGQRNA